MRRLRGAVLATLLAAGAPASGQQGVEPPVAPGGAEYRPTVEEYTVQRGDTLWDICARLTGSPWFWPRVWAYNPEITNPHWIYPGDLVRFRPSDQPLPRLAELASGQRELPREEPEASTAPPIEEAPAFEVVKPPPTTTTHRVRRSRRTATLLLTPRELAESGTLTNSMADKLLLSSNDEVFITFPAGQRPSPGQRYMVYRTVKTVFHPVTNARFGYMTQVTGFATIRASATEVSRATLTEAVAEVERGQLVAPLVQLPLLDRPPTNAKVPINGYVLAVEFGVRFAAERQLVFVDIGSGSGLEPGNRLAVFVEEDPVKPAGGALPLTPVAVLMAVDVRETATTCVVLDSRQEIAPGLRVRTLLR